MAPHGWFYRVRVAVLGWVLASVTLWACNDYRDRQARTDYTRPVRVALVLLRYGDVQPTPLRNLAERSRELERRLAAEFRRYRPTAAEPAIQIVTYGPIDVAAPPPAPTGEGFFSLVEHAVALYRYTSDVDARAQVPTHGLDSRIYLVATQPSVGVQRFVEGFSESGGRVGVARVELDATTVDLGLFVAAHELLHTLGATDKYHADGSAHLPEGLGDPQQRPLYPQLTTEVMARSRVLAPGSESVPDTLDELRVGRWTAREIGWVR